MLGYRGFSPQHAAVRGAVGAFVRVHGTKRGLALAAEAIGIGERAARHAWEGTHFAADDDRAAAADAARLALAEEQLAQLRAEIEALEARRHGMGVDRPGRDVARRARDLLRSLVHLPRPLAAQHGG